MNRRSISACLALVLAWGPLAVQAVEIDASFDADVKATSEYLWRGTVINEDWCLQPSFTAGAGGFSLNVWGTWDLTEVSNSTENTRMDLTLDYTHAFDPAIVRGGLIAYVYKDSLVRPWQKDTFEVYGGCDIALLLSDTWTLILPSLTVYYDFVEIEGFYATAGVVNSVEFSNDKDSGITASLDLRLEIGAGDEKYNRKHFSGPTPADEESEDADVYEPAASLVDLTAQVALPITFNKIFTVTPALKYMSLIDSEIKDSAEAAGEETDGTAYSVTLGLSF